MRCGYIHPQWDRLGEQRRLHYIGACEGCISFVPFLMLVKSILQKYGQLHIEDWSIVTFHFMVGSVLFRFVKRCNMTTPKDIMLFMVVTINCPKSIFCEMASCRLHSTNCLLSHIAGCAFSSLWSAHSMRSLSPSSMTVSCLMFPI